MQRILNTFRPLKLLLPAIIPSWRFFDVIAPSPRIEIAILQNKDDEPENWQDYRARPTKLSLRELITRMVWNVYWNETLFLVSCAERLVNGEEAFARTEIFKCIKREHNESGWVRFRLVFHARQDRIINKHIVYTSPPEPLGQNRS